MAQKINDIFPTVEDLKDERVEEEGDLHLQGIDLDQLLDMNKEQLV